MAKRVSVDRWLFTVTLLLIFIGLVMVFSASAVMAKERYGSGYFFLLRQLGWATGGILAMVVAMKIDYRRYKNPAVVFSSLGLTTLMLISVFFLDHFAKMDANAEFDTSVVWRTSVALDHAILHLDGTAHGVDAGYACSRRRPLS